MKRIKIIKEKDNTYPTRWMPLNKKAFPKWVEDTFIKYKTDKNSNKAISKNKFEPFTYQRFLRDFMQNNSPYRGILLYHGLGSGKTCSSILIAENLKFLKNIVVLLPASLKDNFMQKELKFCGDPKYKQPDGNKQIDEKYYFISYNAPNKLKQLDELGSLDNHVIIIEEAHNLISAMTGESQQAKEIYERLMSAKNVKIIALTGTPIINYAFETAYLFNILRGYLEEVILAIQKNEGDSWSLQQFKDTLDKNPNVNYSEINMINRSISLFLNVPTWSPEFKPFMKDIFTLGLENKLTLKPLRTVLHSLFPTDNEKFADYFINTDIDSKNLTIKESLKNKNMFQRRMMGLISYYQPKEEGYPKVIRHPIMEIPMSNYQFELYEQAREKLERPLERKMFIKEKIPGNFRVYSRQFSNFVFPKSIPRPFEREGLSLVGSVLKLNKGVKNLAENAEATEDKVDISKTYMERIKNARKELRMHPEFLTMTELKDKYSPKMAEMLKLVLESPGLVYVYSHFRTLEGVEAFSIILEANGYANYLNNNKKSKLTYAIFSSEEDIKDRAKTIKLFTSPENKYGDIIKVLLVTSAGAEGLDLKNIRRVLIMEPYWHEIRIEQAIGRAVRRNSHVDLPPVDRVVDVYRFISVMTREQKEISKEIKNKITTDEYVYSVAKRKKHLIDEITDIMKSMAVDCVLNAYDHNGKIHCFSLGDVMNEELAYLPKINEDVVYSDNNKELIATPKTLIPGLIDKTNNKVIIIDMNKKQLFYYSDVGKKSALTSKPKEYEKVYLNVNERKIYDWSSVKNGKNPINIGKISLDGTFIKTI